MKKILTGASMILGASAMLPAVAGEVAEKCSAAMDSIGAPNVETGCACFEEAMDDELASEYLALDLSDWNALASEGLKKTAAQCFPESNTNK